MIGFFAVIFLLVFCLGVHALSSLCLASFFSFSRAQLKLFHLGKDTRLAAVSNLMRDPESVLVTVLLLGSMGGILCQNLVSYLLRDSSYPWLRVAIPMFLSAVFTEIVPKVFALERSISVARSTVLLFLRIHQGLSYPRKIAVSIANLLTAYFSFFIRDFSMPSLEEQIDAVDPSQDVNLISQEEKNLLQGYLRLARLQVREVARPTHELTYFDLETSLENLRRVLASFSGNELPVISGHPANVVGILNVQQALSENELTLSQVRRFLERPCFIPETSSLISILNSLGKNYSKQIFLVNEFGGVNGVVSLPIIMRAIWGKADPVPDHIPSFFKQIGDAGVIASGRMDLENFQRLSRITISARCGQATLGGWIVAQCRELLLPGSVIELDGLRIHILSVENCLLKHLYIQFLERNSKGERQC
ncbi:CNNM domain-containing protein [Candidatus Similichlamydia laticola]|uniref:Hemolysin n=1 Tax=Candidatus Similichlamydia laticola TaxID=2170265 RepID=A0A369KCW3_9BACT|nr:CNNM domain-containing protein [Candidatus Similichlamydia laticola]RDB31442.1 Hemolysin [Candidatus Similichlamydia laticola]